MLIETKASKSPLFLCIAKPVVFREIRGAELEYAATSESPGGHEEHGVGTKIYKGC